MPDAKSGRVHILHHLAVPGGVSTKDTGNHLLLSLTRRSQRCRSGSEISGARLYQRQGAERRSGGLEGCGIRDELIIALQQFPPIKFAIPTRVASSFVAEAEIGETRLATWSCSNTATPTFALRKILTTALR